jgi:predicted transcriptional regulator
MNSTFPIEDTLIEEIETEAHRTGKTVREIVNEAIRVGLREMRVPENRKPYRPKTVSMGHPSRIDLDRATKIAMDLEMDEIVRKMASTE